MLPSPDLRQFLSKKLFLGKLLPKPKLNSKFELASFNNCKNKYGCPKFFWDAPIAWTPATPKPKLCTKFELASFNDCKNKWGSKMFLDALLARNPTYQFWS